MAIPGDHRSRKFLSLFSIPAALVCSISILAPWTDAVAQASDTLMEEIVVTAQKREERLLDVPLAC